MPFAINNPIENPSLAEKVYKILKEQIIRGHLAPGEKLNIHKLSKEFRVSRTPVKEAINHLSLQGLITIQSRKCTFVSIWEPKKVQEMFDFRLMLEVDAAESSFQCSDSLNLEAMDEALREAGALFSSNEEFNYGTFTTFDQQFHLLIVDGAQNSYLRQTYDSLNAHIQIMRVYWGRARERALQSHKEHLDVFEAFKQRSLPKVKETLSAHILNTRNNILQILPLP